MMNNNFSKNNLKNKVALITGITGQDGSYLAELLLKRVMRFMALKEGQVTSILKE